MQIHQYFAIGLRIFAVALLIYGIQFIGPVIEYFRFGTVSGIDVSLLFIVLNPIVPWIIASLLWLFPISIAKSFLAPSLDSKVEPISNLSIMTVFVAGIGLYVFSFGVIDMSYWLTIFFLIAQSDSEIPNDTKAGLIATTLQLGFSLLLIIKCRTVSNYINRVAR